MVAHHFTKIIAMLVGSLPQFILVHPKVIGYHLMSAKVFLKVVKDPKLPLPLLNSYLAVIVLNVLILFIADFCTHVLLSIHLDLPCYFACYSF